MFWIFDIGWKLAIMVMAGIGIVTYLDNRKQSQPERDRQRNERKVAGHGTAHSDDDWNSASTQESEAFGLDFLGHSGINAGEMVKLVPNLDPGRGDPPVTLPSTDRMVTAVFRGVNLMPQGNIPIEMVLMDMYALVAIAGKGFVGRVYDATDDQYQSVEDERKRAIEAGDMTIENFLGKQWRIVGAAGDHRGPNGEKSCSQMQCLDFDPDLKFALQECLKDKEGHNYYDLRARAEGTDGTQRDSVLYAFYIGGTWKIIIGRFLTEGELATMEVVQND